MKQIHVVTKILGVESEICEMGIVTPVIIKYL